MSLVGRRIHVAGSANPGTPAELVAYAHQLVRSLVRGAIKEGATLVVQAGPEPRLAPTNVGSPAMLFDWTILDEAMACLRSGTVQPSINGELLIIATSSEKAADDMPDARRPLWEELLHSGAVRLECIRPGSRSAQAIRELQAREGNVLITIGGGAGVEDLATTYAMRRLPIIPLDAPIGASRGDGTVGGEGLARLALTRPRSFFRLGERGTESARLEGLSTRGGTIDPDVVASRTVRLLKDLARSQAFFVRLVNHEHPDFQSVESFFRGVVGPVGKEFGYQRYQVGTNEPSNAFINAEVFDELHHSPLAIVDLTGERPNCFIELGYALRGQGKVIVTARKGTKLPFDTNAIPCHFWRDDLEDVARQATFREAWHRNITRPPLVRPTPPF